MKSKALKRIAAAALCLTLVLGLLLGGGGDEALAYTSLPHIEELVSTMKAGRESFVVLELTPQKGAGSIGYYMKGGEPCADWPDIVAAIEGPEARAAYMSALFSNLTARGLMSSEDDAPLKLQSPYAESFPWSEGIAEGTPELRLVDENGNARQETATGVRGTFTNELGDYDAHYEYARDESGSHVQIVADLISVVQPEMHNGHPVMAMVGTDPNDDDTYGKYVYWGKDEEDRDILLPAENNDQLIIARCHEEDEVYTIESRDEDGNTVYLPANPEAFDTLYEHNPALGEGFDGYYYRPVFRPFNNAEAGEFPEEWPESAPIFTLGDEGIYEYYATTTDDLVLDLSVQYYVLDSGAVPSAGPPSETAPDTSGYIASRKALGCYGISESGFRDAGAGYFTSTLTHYEFVGRGNGDHSFQYDAAGPDVFDIKYGVVCYTGGFTNNDWFLKHVFNRSDADLGGMGFIVNSLTPAELSAQTGMASVADLIVLSAGLSLSDGGALTSLYNGSNDISAQLAELILKAEQDGAPVVLEAGLENVAAPNLSSLAAALKTRAAESFQNQMNMDFDGTPNADWGETTPDMQGGFVGGGVLCWDRAAYRPLASNGLAAPIEGDAQKGFMAVIKEIEYENWLRQRQGQSDPEQLIPSELSLASLLRYIINSSGARAVTPKTSIRVLELQPSTELSDISPQTVSDWLGGSIPASGISIDTVSAYEFIGTLDDLNVEYDLIYVGSSTEGLNVENGATVFNDESMNGLVYFNIGDEFRATYGLAGLLNRDYDGSTLDYTGKGNLFRFSGNDLTKIRRDSLLDFAGAGYPVILANDLVRPSTGVVEVEAMLSGEVRPDNEAALTVTLTSADPRYSPRVLQYSWYRDGVLVADMSGGVAVLDNVPEGHSADYHCVVTLDGGAAPIRTNTVNVSRSGVVSVVQSGERVQGSYNSGSDTLTVSLGADGYSFHTNSNTLQLSMKLGKNKVEPDNWRWEYSDSGNGNWTRPNGGSENEYTLVYNRENVGYYRYVATYGGREYASNTVWLRYYYIYDLDGQRGSNTYNISRNPVVFDLDVNINTYSNGRIRLEASVTNEAGDLKNSDFSFVWSRTDQEKSVSKERTHETTAISDEITYYCKADPKKGNYNVVETAVSYYYTVSYGGVRVSSSGEPGSGTFNMSESVNPQRVDNSSYMYEALSGILDRPNVMAVNKTGEARAELIKYLNLSKPAIIWAEEAQPYPVEYSFNDGKMTSLTQSTDGHYYLRYSFSIENKTEATPSSTTYDAMLFIDLNSDGKFDPLTEEITDVVIRGADGALINPDGDGVYRLRADAAYTLTRQMPNGYAGIIPWQLSIQRNGDIEGIRASTQGYSRIAPAKNQVESIKILQINSSNNDYYSLDLEDQLKSSTTEIDGYYKAVKTTAEGSETLYFNGLFGKLMFEVEDFDISVVTISTNGINGSSFTHDNKSYDLTDFDMLIIGFADVYGNLSENASRAIVSYAESGAPILFTHDTTSATNYNGYIEPNYTKTGSWGYFFNTILRDSVGLDRYGITSDNNFRSALKAASLNVAQSAQTVLDAGYSLAYKPKSARTEVVPETQGFTNYFLMTQNGTRIGKAKQYLNTDSGAGYVNGRRTDKVTQVNTGQITTYPYDVNIMDLEGGIASSMTVANTHEQYYQVNMNADDIVVWYCLANGGDTGDEYYMRNDVTNAYYIYSKGSITYSGMGHFATGTNASSFYTGGGTTYEDEAKLFVNTMIAAYRTEVEPPTVMFTADSSGETRAEYFFLTSEYSDNGASGGLLELDSSFLSGTDATKIYFKISDPNLNTGKSISMDLYYCTDDTVTEEEVTRATSSEPGQRSFASLRASNKLIPVEAQWHSADSVAGGELKGGLVYYVYLPQTILDIMSSPNVLSLKLFLRITATIDGEPVEGAGVDSIELRKIGLFQLN